MMAKWEAILSMSSMGMVMKWMVDGQANTPITESMHYERAALLEGGQIR
jgi:hypothetical protein